MGFNLFKKKDPICGMKQEKGKGTEKDGNWFCSVACEKKFAEQKSKHNTPKKSCCSK